MENSHDNLHLFIVQAQSGTTKRVNSQIEHDLSNAF
jgi:hypothetical protein